MKYLAPAEARMKSVGSLKYLEELRSLARKNRNNPTVAESKFWKLVSYQKIGYKFIRQKPIGRYILDFYCSKLMLDVEIDGDSHDGKRYMDKWRSLYLLQRGIETIRFRNEEVLNDSFTVKDKLLKLVEKRKHSI